jgi:hypothetical protein
MEIHTTNGPEWWHKNGVAAGVKLPFVGLDPPEMVELDSGSRTDTPMLDWVERTVVKGLQQWTADEPHNPIDSIEVYEDATGTYLGRITTERGFEVSRKRLTLEFLIRQEEARDDERD